LFKKFLFLNLVIFAGNNQHFSFFEKLSNLRKNILSNCFKKKQKDWFYTGLLKVRPELRTFEYELTLFLISLTFINLKSWAPSFKSFDKRV